MCERLTKDAGSREGHEFRYRLAVGFVEPGDVVVDAACGTGYGARFFYPGVDYVGVDRTLDALEVGEGSAVRFIEADLCQWWPDFSLNVFVSFETIEHLADPTALVVAAKRARRWVLMSTPTVPTTLTNPYHRHDFEPGDLQRLMIDDDWAHYQTVSQPAELAEISVFERRP